MTIKRLIGSSPSQVSRNRDLGTMAFQNKEAITVDSATINGGTANGVAYLNGSKVLTTGSGLTFDGSSMVLNTSTSSDALRITQTGTGNCLVVGDQSGDTTPFVIDANGNVTIGGSSSPVLTVSRPAATNAAIALTTTGGTMYIGNSDGTAFVVDDDNDLTIGPLFKVSNDGASVIAANSSSDGLRITQTGTGNALVVEDSTSPDSTPFVINSNGRVILNNASAGPSGINYNFQNLGKSASEGMGLGMFTNDTDSMNLRFAKSRSTTVGSFSAVQADDELGIIAFYGDDGSDLNNRGASIVAYVDGTVATNSIPSRIVFSTTAVGGTSTTERMRLDSNGNVGIGTSSPTEKLQISAGASSTLLLGYSDGVGVGYRLRSNVTTTVDNGFVIEYNDGTDLYRVDYDGGNGFHAWYMGGSERMRIDASGQLGIGNTAPGYRLDVTAGDTTASLGYAMRLRSNATAKAATLQFTDNGVSVQNGYIAVTDAGLMNLDGSSVIGFRTNGTERMRIDSSGNVGIGVSPVQPFTAARSISGGAPAASGSAADPNGVARFQYGSVVTDFGAYSNGTVWIQNRSVNNYATKYDLAFQPNGGNTLHVGPNGGLGYGAGAGGTVTQATSKGTTVTLNKPTGQITMNNSALAAGAKVTFAVNNSLVTVSDVPHVVVASNSVGDSARYRASCTYVGAGAFYITVENIGAVSYSDNVYINFAIIKGAAA